MTQFRFTASLAVLLCVALLPVPASAFFHLWDFTEFFSNHDGSVQFIELRNTSNNEHFANGAQIRSMATGNVFTFSRNLDSPSTAGKSLLIATSGFGALPGGVTPDFILPTTGFFDPAGDTITLFAGITIDTKTFSSVPTDGVMSRVYPSNTLDTNSPTNFSGASGSVDLPPPSSTTGDYNGNGTVDAADYVVWRDTLGQGASPPGSGADGDESGAVDAGDFGFWKGRFGDVVGGGALESAGGVPEPTPLSLALIGLYCLAVRTRSRAE